MKVPLVNYEFEKKPTFHDGTHILFELGTIMKKKKMAFTMGATN